LRFLLDWLRLSGLAAVFIAIVSAQTPAAAPSDSGDDYQRIFGVLPNYLTVSDPQAGVEPLTSREKFVLFARQTYDPGTIAGAALGAGISQAHNGDPKYGDGSGPYGERFGAAMADLTSQNFFGGVLLAAAFHEDPRYFRRGPQYGFWNRFGYSLSRVLITRTDGGTDRFSYSATLGMAMGIGLSNVYYPASSVNGTEIASRFGTSLISSALSNILPEFWPDIHQKLFHRKGKPKDGSGAPKAPAPAIKQGAAELR